MTDRADRIAGVLLAAAAGDALGVPYEAARRLRDDEQPRMTGGGLGDYAPAEYSDDTQMAVCIAQVAAQGLDLRTPEALDEIAWRFLWWRAEGATDIGIQTAAVLKAANPVRPAAAAYTHPVRRGLAARMAAAAAEVHHASGGRSAGNGSLMRTAPVALAYLDRPADEVVAAARAVSALTHYDPLAADACVLWCVGIRAAILHGTVYGVQDGLGHLPAERQEFWSRALDAAEGNPPGHFPNNGYVVSALQAAWSAVIRAADLPDALVRAVRAGGDTDTVAAIAGALAGARWGLSAIPLAWRRDVHGWPGMTAEDLVVLATRIPTSRAASMDG